MVDGLVPATMGPGSAVSENGNTKMSEFELVTHATVMAAVCEWGSQVTDVQTPVPSHVP
jgi:hypothetical protein